MAWMNAERRGAGFHWLLLVSLLAALGPGAPARAETYPDPGCLAGQTPVFVGLFATLKERLGDVMGEPLDCASVDPLTGDVAQTTSTGVLFSSALTGAITFTAGFRHWVLAGNDLSAWDGNADPGTQPDGEAAYATASAGPSAPELPLNGRFLLLNMQGALFHDPASDFAENVAYARWMGAGTIRVFATDNNRLTPWSGTAVGERIATYAPVLRAANVKLVVALVNNHRPVPGEAASSSGWVDGYYQLLAPFFAGEWRGPYRSFVRGLIGTVVARGARDVIQAWEIGNELHTPRASRLIVPFIRDAVAAIRDVDGSTPIYPGTMGANHLEPWNASSPVARWLYCDAPLDAYTLHAYDWVSRQRSGDMPIEWDLDNITARPCPSGRALPVIVEELGTSRALAGVYAAGDEAGRLAQEINQLRFVLPYSQVKGIGVWNAESPRVIDRTYYDNRRGLTSYGAQAGGGGSCYDPTPLPAPGARCRLERILKALPAVP